MSTSLAKLFKIYKDCENIDVVSGLNPFHFNNHRDAAFTHFLKDGASLTDDLGISLWETILLESFCTILKPARVFIVGNGLGWSALALSLINPGAAVVVIDPANGIELVNRVAFRYGLRCVAVRASSPLDNKAVIDTYFEQPPDLVLIDGLHTNEAVLGDFLSAHALCGSKATYFFHDVVNFDLYEAIGKISAVCDECEMVTALLASSPSGMAVVYPRSAPPDLQALVDVFAFKKVASEMIASRSGGTIVKSIN